MLWTPVKSDFASVFASHSDTLINGDLTYPLSSLSILDLVPGFSYGRVSNPLDKPSEFPIPCSSWVT